ncbi:MAG: hypothetical protein AUH30_05040 [Candidatus Rokubacteria bacterium 13_1_40CM_68_15]|nr:MAG: hypothetical protein AUH30_05040 [Candidatus Rokubacteria bacterium 13_1_40CM_68_15]
MFLTLLARSARPRRRAATFLALGLAHVPSFPDVRPGWAMSKSLLALNLFMAALSLFFLIRIADTVLRRGPALPLRVASSASTPAPVNLGVTASSRSSAVYDLIAARSLFHPDRAVPKRSDALLALPPAANLMLYGVVWSEDNPLAYLEDPASKKIFGYKTGDPMAGGYVERIETDRIVIRRTDGPLEIMLRAPNKPRPVVSGALPVDTTAVAVPPAPPASSADRIPPGIYRRVPKD